MDNFAELHLIEAALKWDNRTEPLDACLNTSTHQELSGSHLEATLFQWLFPIFAVAGIVGNALNMLVLRDKKMKRAYFLFYCIALSDIFFFFALAPAWLASYKFFAQDMLFRHLFFNIKVHFYGFANWVSAFNIWVVCLISLERFIAVHDPMRTNRMELAGLTNKRVILVIIILTFIFTSYVHYNTLCKVKQLCHGTQLAQACMDVRADWSRFGGKNPSPAWLRQLVAVLRYAHAGIAIALPLIVVILFNVLLIYHAQNVGFSFNGSANKKRGQKLSDGKEMDSSEPQPIYRRHSETTNQQRMENRVTNIAIVIVSVFLVTNLPSAVILVFHTLYPFSQNSMVDDKSMPSYTAQVICSFLSMAGKALNFIIFCTLSENFRRRLRTKILCGSLAQSSGIEVDPKKRIRRFNL